MGRPPPDRRHPWGEFVIFRSRGVQPFTSTRPVRGSWLEASLTPSSGDRADEGGTRDDATASTPSSPSRTTADLHPAERLLFRRSSGELATALAFLWGFAGASTRLWGIIGRVNLVDSGSSSGPAFVGIPRLTWVFRRKPSRTSCYRALEARRRVALASLSEGPKALSRDLPDLHDLCSLPARGSYPDQEGRKEGVPGEGRKMERKHKIVAVSAGEEKRPRIPQ